MLPKLLWLSLWIAKLCSSTIILGWLSNRMGTSYDNRWNSLDSLLIGLHFMIWVFVLCTPLSSDVPVPLQNEPIILSGMKSFVRRRQPKQKHRKKSEKRKMKTKVLIWSCFSYTLSLCSVSSNCLLQIIDVLHFQSGPDLGYYRRIL